MSERKSKNAGRRTRSLVAYGATFLAAANVGCRGKPFMIGSTTKRPSGDRCCVAEENHPKNEGN